MAQTSGFDLSLKSKHILTARCLMLLIGLLTSMEQMVPQGCPHMRPFHLKEHWRYPQSLRQPSSLVRDHFSSPRVVAKPCKCNEGCGHPKDHSIQNFQMPQTKVGALRASLYKKFVVRQGKRLHINVLELKAVSLALKRFRVQCQNQTVLVAMDNSTVVAYINKQGGTLFERYCRENFSTPSVKQVSDFLPVPRFKQAPVDH